MGVLYWGVLARACILTASRFSPRGAQLREEVANFYDAQDPFALLTETLKSCVPVEGQAYPHNLYLPDNPASWLSVGAASVSPFYSLELRQLWVCQAIWFTDSLPACGIPLDMRT